MHGSLSANVSSMAHLAKPSLFRAVKSHAVCFDLIRSDWIVRFFFMYGSNVRGSKELSWYGIDGCDETRACNEVNSSGGYIRCYQQYWNQPKGKSYYLVDGYAHLSSGLACGLAGLSAVMAIGIVGDAGVRVNAQQPKFFVE
ncbi:hypothetical protein Bca4012_035052 [Brassica carinata]|uniref:V-ATPase proteolipid subunit C-like domain-containing protein n=1 Tax=Brassica carinata TaxID=52824 RepID=A0A8X7P2Q9_BRACI|nr:hypothetical protein Bca52824_094136 [Brassica carinata]